MKIMGMNYLNMVIEKNNFLFIMEKAITKGKSVLLGRVVDNII